MHANGQPRSHRPPGVHNMTCQNAGSKNPSIEGTRASSGTVVVAVALWFASFAYVLLCALRWIGLAYTQFATATSGTLRPRLLKIGALVRNSVRWVVVAMASACPWQLEFTLEQAMLGETGCLGGTAPLLDFTIHSNLEMECDTASRLVLE